MTMHVVAKAGRKVDVFCDMTTHLVVRRNGKLDVSCDMTLHVNVKKGAGSLTCLVKSLCM